jgi:hypothetical protein
LLKHGVLATNFFVGALEVCGVANDGVNGGDGLFLRGNGENLGTKPTVSRGKMQIEFNQAGQAGAQDVLDGEERGREDAREDEIVNSAPEKLLARLGKESGIADPEILQGRRGIKLKKEGDVKRNAQGILWRGKVAAGHRSARRGGRDQFCTWPRLLVQRPAPEKLTMRAVGNGQMQKPKMRALSAEQTQNRNAKTAGQVRRMRQ